MHDERLAETFLVFNLPAPICHHLHPFDKYHDPRFHLAYFCIRIADLQAWPVALDIIETAFVFASMSYACGIITWWAFSCVACFPTSVATSKIFHAYLTACLVFVLCA